MDMLLSSLRQSQNHKMTTMHPAQVSCIIFVKTTAIYMDTTLKSFIGACSTKAQLFLNCCRKLTPKTSLTATFGKCSQALAKRPSPEHRHHSVARACCLAKACS